MLPTHQPHTTAAHPSNASQLIPLLITGKRYRRSDSDSDSGSSQGRLKKLKQKEQSAQLSKDDKLLSVMNRVDITQKARIEKLKKALDKGANINVQHSRNNDNTPLHLAVQKNEPQVAEFLLDRGADISIKNKEGKRAIDLLSHKKRKSNSGQSTASPWDSALIARLEPVAAVHKPVAIAGPSGLSAGGSSGPSEPLEYAAGGLKHSLHGNIYQLQLLTLFMKRALDNNYDFLLATEMNAAEKFDDVVFRHTEQGETHFRFLQAKHRQEESQRLTFRDLTNQSEGDFSLSKYFASYLKIKVKSEFQGHQDFILCTNIDLAVEELRKEETFTVEEIKVQDSFINIQDSTKTPHRYRLTVNQLSDFYRQLQINPEARQLATVLMERLEKGGKLDLTVDIFKRYHRGLVANHIIDVPNNKLHSDFVSGHRLSLSAQSFREIFIQTTLKNRIYQNNPNKLWDAFKNKKLSISKNFGSGDETSPFPTNSAIDASEIDAFFKQFTLAVNQPNENQLRTVLAREIGHQIQFNLLDSELAADHIQRQMLDWFKERGGKFLSAQDGKQYFAQASARINTLLSTGCSIEQAAKLANYGIHFSQDAITALQNSMQMELRVLHLMTAETRLEAIKVYQSLQTLPGYQQRDSVLFTELRTLSLKKPRQQLFKAFNADKSHPLLVIECSSETVKDGITEIVGQLTSILESPSQKKLIIIAPQTHPLAEAFREQATLTYHNVVEAPTFSRLAIKTQQALLDKEVLFQGHRVTLQQLLPSDFPRDTLPLMDLIESSEEKPLPIGDALPRAPSETEGYYLERLVTPPFIKYSITQAQRAGMFPDLIAFNEQSFNTMCQDHPRKAVHWLQRTQHNALLLWRQSRGDTTALQPYVEDSPHAIATTQKGLALTDCFTLPQLESHRVVLLSAPAGMGKSTFLTHTAQQLKRQQPDHWVIRIDLNQQTEALQHLQHPTAAAAAKWIVKAAQFDSAFEQPLLRQALQAPGSTKVRILLDGFDEISPTHQTPALKLLQGLREQGMQVWVTTRPHWEERLAQHRQTLPFSLKPLSRPQQSEFLTQYCCTQHQLVPTQVTAVEKSAETLLNHLVRSDISTENPLQLQMLAELFSDNFKTRQSFPETELKRFSRLELYEQFVKTKYKIFRHKGSEAGAQIDKVTKSSIDVENNHQRLAVTLLFPTQQRNLLAALSLNEIKLLSPEALARYGMVTVVKNAPQFIHRTYAEYFIAERLWERVIKNPQSPSAGVDFLLCEVLPQKAQQGVNAFLEGWLSKERSQLTQESYAHYGNRLKALQASERPLHLSRGDGSVSNAPQRALQQAAQSGNKQIIDFLLSSLKRIQATETIASLLKTPDSAGNTLLHTVVESRQEGQQLLAVVERLLQEMAEFSQENAYQTLQTGNREGQSALHLSVEAGQEVITERLLQWNHQKLAPPNFEKLLLQKNRQRQTALRLSILENHPPITKALLSWYQKIGIDWQQVIAEVLVETNTYGKTCYELVSQSTSDAALVSTLQWVTERINSLPEAVLYSTVEALNRLYSMRHSKAPLLLQLLDAAELPPLHQAVLRGDVEQVLQTLPGPDALFAQASAFKLTPLHLAVLSGQELVVQQLLTYGKNHLTSDRFSVGLAKLDLFAHTALHLAALNGRLSISEHLLNSATSNGKRFTVYFLGLSNHFGQTALHLAINARQEAAVDQLLAQAEQFSRPTLIKQLSTADHYSQQPLHLAMMNHGEESLKSLLKYSNSLKYTKLQELLLASTTQGDTPIHLAVLSHSVEKVDQILICADEAALLNQIISAQDSHGNTPLHLAVLEQQPALVEYLLEYENAIPSKTVKMMLSSQNHQGNTPLHLAIQQAVGEIPETHEIVKKLFDELKQLVETQQELAAKKILLTQNHGGVAPLHLAAARDPSLLNSLLPWVEMLSSNIVKALLLTPNANGRTLLSHLLASHYYVAERMIDQILKLSSQALTLSEQQAMLQSVVESPSVVQRAGLDFVQRLRQRLTQVISEHTELCSVSLTGLRILLQQTHWLSLSDCAAGSSRTRRAASGCIETQTERELAYQPLEDSASYLPEQIQAAHQHSLFTLMVAWQREDPQQRVEALMDYQRAVGAILSEGAENHSPREADILRTHYQQAQQFHAQFSQETLFQKITKLPEGTPGKRQSWLYKQGRYTVSLLWDGNRYALYSPDFNYQQLLYAPSDVTKAQIESWVNAFLQWRTGKASSTTIWTLPETLPGEARSKMRSAAFWKPQHALPDSILLKQSGSQIEGIPLKALQALIRLRGKPVADEAWHADFLRLHHKNIRLHVESLHQVLPTLNANEQQALHAAVRKYGWPADNSDLRGLSAEERHPFLEYHRLVMETFKEKTVTLQHLSEYSWQALKQGFTNIFSELPAAIKNPFTRALWNEVKPKLQQAWSMGKPIGSQALFFLPDLIRFGNSGDPRPIMATAGMIAGDHQLTFLLGRLRTTTVNTVHKNFLLILKRLPPTPGVFIGMLTGHANNIAKMLHRIPIHSPLFAVLTTYSIVDLSQQLQALPADSTQRPRIIFELVEQSFALALIASSPLLGAAANPVWLAFTASCLFISAEIFRQTEQLNVSFWKALGFSLGFHQDELQAIYQGRELAQITLDYAERLANALNATIGWTIVKVPALNTGEWRNVTVSQIPSEVARAINQQIDIPRYNAIKNEYYYKVNEETKEVHGFKRIRKFEAIQPECNVKLESYGGCPPSRGNLLADYWQQRTYHATPVATTMNFTAACGSWERGNSFLSSFPAPWGNYTLETTVRENIGLSNAVYQNKQRELQIERMEAQLKSQLTQHYQSMSAPHYYKREIPILININKPVEINKTLINPPENMALYADKRTFFNPTAQRALYFFFDPREGDSRLVIGADGLQIWDQMNQNHNPNYSPALNTQEYLIVVQVGHKAYSDAILFPPRAPSQLSVADKTHRIASRYLIQSDYATPFEVIDEAAHVEMVFLQSPTVKTTLSSLFLNPQNFQIILSAAEQTSYFTLLGNKTYLSLTLTPQQAIDHLHLAAQQVEIMQAQGINSSSRLTLDCQVKSFTVTLRSDLTVESCGDTLFWQGNPADNITNIHYTKFKLSNSTADALYQIQLPPETSAFSSILKTLRRQLIHNSTRVYTTLGLSGYWLVPRNSSALKQLHILGQLDQKNAILILTETQYTLIRFTATLQPEFVLVEHDTAQDHLNTSLRLQRAEKDTQFAQWFPTPEEGMRVIQGLTVLATLPSEGRGAVLILQSPLGYPEIHRFPNSSQCITLNDLHYQVGPGGKLYVVGTIDGRITADRLLRYNDTEHRPVGLSFPTALNASQLALDNGTLSVNQIQLIQLPEQTPLYFGPLDQQQEIISLLALQDTVLPPSTKPPEAILPESSAHPHRHHHQRRHRRQIPDMPSSASRPTPWITTLWKGLLERLPFYSTPLLGLGIREKPTDPPVTKEIFSEPSEPLDLDKLNSLMMMLSFFLALRRIRKQQKPTAKSLPSEQAITEEQRIEWRKQLDRLEKNVEDLFKRVARDGKIVNKRHEWPQWWLEDLQEQYGQLTQLDQASQEEITVFEEKLQATLNELDEILRPSAVPPGWKRHAGQSFHKTDTTEPEPKPKPAEDLDDIIQDINILFSENSDIISAINKNDLTRVRSYIEENKNVNARSKGGRPLLMVAVESSCSDELIELLIDNGADINAEDRDGESAINLAVYNGSFRLIKLLINKGVKIKDKTEKNSPFSSVAESGLPQRTQDQVIKLLTEWKYIDKASNATNLTRILVQQVPAMHSSLVDNAFTLLSTSNPDPVYSNRVSGLLPMSSQ